MPGRFIILSGPPGAGKTTLAVKLVERSPAPAAVHLHSDDFYDYIKKGFILPWLPESQAQNATVAKALAAAAIAYCDGGFDVIMDGVVGPWFIDTYVEAAARAGVALHYVILRADKAVSAARARSRGIKPIADYPPRIHEAFADLDAWEDHVVETSGIDAEEAYAAVRDGVADQRFVII